MNLSNRLFPWVLCVSLFSSTAVNAGGAYIYEMASPAETGFAGAGLAARADDAGTVFTNPAGMNQIEDSELLAGGTLTYIYAPYSPDSSTPVEGRDGDTNVFVPGASVAYVYSVSDDLKLGLSMQNYFGLALDWQDDWVGRYTAVKLQLVAPQLQPTVSYQITDWLSVGGGVGLTLGYLYDKKRVESIDGTDGKLRVSDQDFAVQYNLGIMLEPTENTRIGIRYLTETDLEFEDAPQLSGLALDLDADRLDLGVTMPQSVMAGIHHQLNDEWAILGSVGWDEWSSFGKVNFDIDGTDVNRTVDADFRDVWHFGVGTEHQLNTKWKLTAGYSYDTSMMSDATRPLVVPLGHMQRYALGFQYQKRKGLTLGGGLSFLWEGNLPTKTTAQGVSGKYENVSLTFLSFYARWH